VLETINELDCTCST